MSSPSQETAGLVLASREHGESDKIITLLTSEGVRVTGIAKGANRSKKRFLNKLELFSHITFQYSHSRRSSLLFIADAELISSFIHLRTKYECYIVATFLRETLLIATPDGGNDAGLFSLFHWALSSLNEGRAPLAVPTVFLLRLFERIGYCPDLTGCSGCGMDFSLEKQYSFNHLSGGMLCSTCRQHSHVDTTPLSTGTIRLLRQALSDPLDRLHRLHFSRQALQQALPMLYRYGRNLFQRDIHSWKAVKKMF